MGHPNKLLTCIRHLNMPCSNMLSVRVIELKPFCALSLSVYSAKHVLFRYSLLMTPNKVETGLGIRVYSLRAHSCWLLNS